MDTIIKKSTIKGKGVFAARDFKKGEVVLRWHPRSLTKTELGKLSKKEKISVARAGRKYILIQSPEKYINHFCSPNTFVKHNCDIACQNIKKGEEITSDYTREGAVNSFKCRCGSKKCQKFITSK